jgi:[ribosomal protein S18]-alanine N-acetyltransferase
MPFPVEVRLRPFVESDLPQVLNIEQASFSLPWKAEFFLKELHNPHGWSWVAEKEDTIVGYLCGWFVVDEGEILKIAVHPASRRCGIGKFLIGEVMRIAGQRRIRTLHLEVRVSNAAAIALYTLSGFREVSRRKRYYEDGEDALLMKWESGDECNEK